MAYGENYWTRDNNITFANRGGQDKFGNNATTDSGDQTGTVTFTATVSTTGGISSFTAMTLGGTAISTTNTFTIPEGTVFGTGANTITFHRDVWLESNQANLTSGSGPTNTVTVAGTVTSVSHSFTTGLDFTHDRAFSPVSDSVRLGASSGTGTDLYFWDKHVSKDVNSSSGFNVNNVNGNHVSWYNSTMEIDGAVGPGSGNVGIAFANLSTNPNSESGGYSWNYYNCMVNILGGGTGADNASAATIGAGDIKDSTINFEAGHRGNTSAAWVTAYGGYYNGVIYLPAGSNLTDTTVNVWSPNTGTRVIGDIVFRGAPGEVSGNIVRNVQFTHASACNSNVMYVEPSFAEPAQPSYFLLQSTSGQATQGANGVFTVGPFLWGAVAATNAASSTFSSKISHGGGGNLVGQSVIQCYGYEPTFYEDVAQTTAAEGINIYASTNLRLASLGTGTQTSFAAAYNPSSFTVNSSHLYVNRFTSGSTGKPASRGYSQTGASLSTAGYIDWARLSAVSTNSTTSFARTIGNQNAPSGVIVSPIQAARKTDAANGAQSYTYAGQVGCESTYDIRGYAYDVGLRQDTYSETSLLGTNTTVSVPINTETLIYSPSTVVKSTNIVSTSKASGTNIQARFPATGTTTVTYNDIHDAVKWLWSDLQVDRPPTFASSRATLEDSSSTDLLNLTVGTQSLGTYFSRSTDTISIRHDQTTAITAGSGEAVQGLVVDTLNCGGTRFEGGTLIASDFTNPVVHTSAITNVATSAAFSECALQGTITVDCGTGATDHRYIAFDDCTETGTGLTVNKGTGHADTRVYVYGAPDGVTLGTDVIPVRTLTVTRNALTGETTASQRGRADLIRVNTDGTTTVIDGDATGTLSGSNIVYSFSSINETELYGDVVFAISGGSIAANGTGVNDARNHVNVGANTVSSANSMTVSVSSQTLFSTAPSATLQATVTLTSTGNTNIGYSDTHSSNAGRLGIGLQNTSGNVLSPELLNKVFQTQVRGTEGYNRLMAKKVTANTDFTFANSVPIIGQVGTSYAQVHETLILISPAVTTDQIVNFFTDEDDESFGFTAFTSGNNTYNVNQYPQVTGPSAGQITEALANELNARLLTRANQVNHGIAVPTQDLAGSYVVSNS